MTVTPDGGSAGPATAVACSGPSVTEQPSITERTSGATDGAFTFPVFADNDDLSFRLQNDGIAGAGSDANFVLGESFAGDLEVFASEDASISTSASVLSGLLAWHRGAGAVSVTSAADITASNNGNGVSGWASGDGDASVTATGGTIRTANTFGRGVFGFHIGTGDVFLTSAADITIGGQAAHGVMGWIFNEDSNGAVTIDVSDSTIRTTSTANADIYGSIHNGWAGAPDGINERTNSLGVLGWTQGLGAVTVRSRANIHTAGTSSEGVAGHISNPRNASALTVDVGRSSITTLGDLSVGVTALQSGTGAVALSSNADITTSGQAAQGVFGVITNTQSTGTLTIGAGGTIRTSSTAAGDLYAGNFANAIGLRPPESLAPPDGLSDPTNADGILGLQEGLGALFITSSADIATAGIDSDGIAGWTSNAGNGQPLSVQVDGGTITTSGDRAHGIYARHDGSGGAININSSADIITRGRESHGIHARIDAGAGPVNIHVREGSIQTFGADSHGVLAHYESSDATSITIFEGASVEAHGDGASAVLARGGAVDAATGKRRQTIVVNGRVTAGAGADGVRMDGGTVVVGPNGVIEALDSSSAAVVSTAASPADTVIVLRPGAPIDTRLQGGITNIPRSGIIIESQDGSRQSLRGVFMVRSAVYEILPQALLDYFSIFPSPHREAAASPPRGLWAKMAYADGKREGRHSTTGAEFDHRRWVFEGGADLAEWAVGSNLLRAGLSAHVLDGDADVSSSVGSGNIETDGWGIGLYAAFRTESSLYADAQLRFTRFESDFDFSDAGPSTERVGADAYSFAAETGLALQEWNGTTLSMRARVSYTNIDIDAFADRASITQLNPGSADSFKAGAGLVLQRPDGIHASLDLEHEFDGETEVNGEDRALRRKPHDTWARTAVGGAYQWGDGRYTLSGALSYATSLRGSSYDFSGNVHLRVNF